MIEAHSKDSIFKTLNNELPRQIKILKKEPINDIGFMTGLDMNTKTRYNNVYRKETRNSKLIGILFAHPQSKLSKSEIINFLPHFHSRSGDAIDFFCVGYGAYWQPNYYPDKQTIITIEGIDWFFSEKAYSDIIDEFQQSTTWKYSGETELFLITAVKENNNIKLDYNSAIVCNLEQMSKDDAFTSVRAFFTDIFNYAKQHSDSTETWGLSDERGLKAGKSVLKDAVISLLPTPLKKLYTQANHYVVTSISKN